MEDRVESLSADSSREQQHNTEADGCGFSALVKRRGRKNRANDDRVDEEPVVQKDGTTISATTTSLKNDEPPEKNLETLQIPV